MMNQTDEIKHKIDLEKFAGLSKLKSVASAREMLRVTKKKLFELTDGSGDSETPTGVTSTPKKGKGAAKTTATPASGKKKATLSKKRGAAAIKNESEDEVAAVTKKVKVSASATSARASGAAAQSADDGADAEEEDNDDGYGLVKKEKNEGGDDVFGGGGDNDGGLAFGMIDAAGSVCGGMGEVPQNEFEAFMAEDSELA